MTRFEDFLYDYHEDNRKELKQGHMTDEGLRVLMFKLEDQLEPKDYRELWSAMEVESDNMAFEGYKKGFKDGIRFLMGMTAL